jgi:tetratricopeptide (TPR) repeat protein
MVMRARGIVLVAVALALEVGCAARAQAVLPAQARSSVDPFIERGCYSCLEQAYATASASGAGAAAFESAVLLVLRSKELGLPFAEWLERARMFTPAGEGWKQYLAIVEGVPADPLSDDRDAILVTRRPQRPVLDQWRKALADGPGSAVFRGYLDLTVVCGPGYVGERDEILTAALDRFPGVPLIAYRAGLCGRTALLHSALARDGQFTDVHLELGRAALQRERPDYDEALNHLRLARAAFPRSATIAAMIGAVHLQREDWSEGLAAYEATLALVPTHRDALIGSAISLSHLNRHAEAIIPATRLLELGSWFIADAHYWRAWNQYRLGRIPEARADVDRAKTMARDAATLVLSGIIGWREGQLEAADEEFQAALNLDFGQCEAASYLGGVRAQQRRWQESLAAFQHAAQCFELAVVTRRKAMADLADGASPLSGVARQIASHERAIAEAEARRIEAVTNIASIERRITPYTAGEAAPVLPSP